MKNFIAISNQYSYWDIIGKFDKLKSALDCTARHWKKANGRIIDKDKKEVMLFKNKEVLTRPMTEKEIKEYI